MGTPPHPPCQPPCTPTTDTATQHAATTHRFNVGVARPELPILGVQTWSLVRIVLRQQLPGAVGAALHGRRGQVGASRRGGHSIYVPPPPGPASISP